MTYEELTTKSKDELMNALLDLKKEQMELRFKKAAGQLEKLDQVRKVRKDIARVQTAMNAPVQVAAKKEVQAKKKTATKKAEKAA